MKEVQYTKVAKFRLNNFYTFLKKAEGCKIKCLFVVDIKKIYYTKNSQGGFREKNIALVYNFNVLNKKTGSTQLTKYVNKCKIGTMSKYTEIHCCQLL